MQQAGAAHPIVGAAHPITVTDSGDEAWDLDDGQQIEAGMEVTVTRRKWITAIKKRKLREGRLLAAYPLPQFEGSSSSSSSAIGSLTHSDLQALYAAERAVQTID